MSRKIDDMIKLKTLQNSYLGKNDTAESAKVALSINWTNILSKPSTFPPSTHNHDESYLGKTAKAASASSADAVAWGNVTSKPSTFAPSSHDHNQVITSNNGGLYEGNGDAADSDRTNVQIKSWFGIGFAPSISGQSVPQNKNALWMNVRSGDMSMRGSLYTEGMAQIASYVSTPTIVSNRLQGRSGANKFYVGESSCRIDLTENYFRLFTSLESSSDYGIRISPAGGASIMVNNVGKHAFNADGSKYGGSIEIEGITYGMAPIDSPNHLIEDIIFDKEVIESGTIVQLNNIFSKSINGKYAVFVNNNKAEVIDKGYDNFKIIGYTGTVDIRIIGKRFDHENEYYKIMGGFEHGVEENVIC